MADPPVNTPDEFLGSARTTNSVHSIAVRAPEFALFLTEDAWANTKQHGSIELRENMNHHCRKNENRYFRVVVVRTDGVRDVRVRNLSRSFAEAVVRALSDTHHAVMEPQNGLEPDPEWNQ
jgi:hypothetical protein